MVRGRHKARSSLHRRSIQSLAAAALLRRQARGARLQKRPLRAPPRAWTPAAQPRQPHDRRRCRRHLRPHRARRDRRAYRPGPFRTGERLRRGCLCPRLALPPRRGVDRDDRLPGPVGPPGDHDRARPRPGAGGHPALRLGAARELRVVMGNAPFGERRRARPRRAQRRRGGTGLPGRFGEGPPATRLRAAPVASLVHLPARRGRGALRPRRGRHLGRGAEPVLVEARGGDAVDRRRDGGPLGPLVVQARPRPRARASGAYPCRGAGRHGGKSARLGAADPGHDPTLGRPAPRGREARPRPGTRTPLVAFRGQGSRIVRGRGHRNALGRSRTDRTRGRASPRCRGRRCHRGRRPARRRAEGTSRSRQGGDR